ncbi:MAG TPA: hypothetical protein ENJ50_06580, partial [Planctomycetaceae bacterium]|nr:hypothetical protein [Planctomycetaceae bacterium]
MSITDSQEPALTMPLLDSQEPAFLVGVTGHMDIPEDQQEAVKEHLRTLFRFLRHGASYVVDGQEEGQEEEQEKRQESVKEYLHALFRFLRHGVSYVVKGRPEQQEKEKEQGQPEEQRRSLGDQMLQSLLQGDPCAGRLGEGIASRLKPVYAEFFERWRGLSHREPDSNDPRHMPIIVMSPLAPGADQLVAQVVLEEEFQKLGFHLYCPLPFVLSTYRDSSTFVRSPGGQPDEADRRRQKEFDRIVKAARKAGARFFSVATADDIDVTLDTLRRRHRRDVGDRDKRRRRYQAVGEYIASFSHLMIAIWDHRHDTDNREGTAAIVHARR